MAGITTSQRRYLLGRKASLVLALGMVAFVGLLQSTILCRNLRVTVPNGARKHKPYTKFHLEHNKPWTISIAEHRPLGDGEFVVFNPSVLEKKEEHQFKDNLRWHYSIPALEQHPGAFEWYHFQGDPMDSKVKGDRKYPKRLLMAQFSNSGAFAEIYKMTKRVNVAYAERWKHDIVFLNAQHLPLREANLASLVQLAWENRDKYDHLLLMDADAMMNNFRYDITRLIPSMEMMVAKRIEGRDDEHTWKIFDTVSLWNLKHLLTPRVQKTWSNRFAEEDALVELGEQLKPYAETEVFTVTSQIGHLDSSYIRTIQFATKSHGLRTVDPEVRIERWKTEFQRTCKRWKVDCSENTSDLRSGSNQNSTGKHCNERREPTWEWRKSRDGVVKTKKRLLVAQYVSYGSYAKLLEMTASVNKMYAQKWNVDFVSVQGTTLVVKDDDGCEPPPQRAMFDKLELLHVGLQKKDTYDQLLLLDADAMIYDLAYDITSLLQDGDLLVAQRGAVKSSHTHTWNINNGIVLWDLHHPMIQEVADEWYALSRSAIERGDAHGDQHYLQAVLRVGNRQQFVRTLNEEFLYRRGTVVKHFTRRHANNEWNNTRVDAREADIELVVQDICEKFHDDCETREQTIYQW